MISFGREEHLLVKDPVACALSEMLRKAPGGNGELLGTADSRGTSPSDTVPQMTLRRCHPGYSAKSWAWPCSFPMGVFWKKSQEPFGAWAICFWSQTVKWWLLKLMFIGKCDKFYRVSLLAVTCLNVHVLVQWPWELLWENLCAYQAAPKLSTSVSLCIKSVTYWLSVTYPCMHPHI